MLRKMRQKRADDLHDMHEEGLQKRFASDHTVSIGEAPLRVPIRVAGEVQGIQVVPRAGSPSLEATISDGTGLAVAVFTGRRRLGGLDCGRAVVFEGVGRQEAGRVVLMNPDYRLLPA